MIINRLKKNESTLCTFTTTGEEIIEGHILGYGDNYPCIVVYNKFEAQFVLLEFGYMKEEGYLYRGHEITSQTVPWTILGHIDKHHEYKKHIKGVPRKYDHMKDMKHYYEEIEKD